MPEFCKASVKIRLPSQSARSGPQKISNRGQLERPKLLTLKTESARTVWGLPSGGKHARSSQDFCKNPPATANLHVWAPKKSVTEVNLKVQNWLP